MLSVELLFVLSAGVFTAIVCGIGTLPFFFVDEISDRITVVLWGFAGGVMLFASLFGFIVEGLAEGTVEQVSLGFLVGVGLVIVADRVIVSFDFKPRELPAADFRKLVLIIGILTVHSFPEGVALGVAFADLGIAGQIELIGLAIPGLAIFITIAVAVQNIPEGLAVAIPLNTMGVAKWKLFFWAVFSSLPQPLGAAIAYVFVTFARQFLPFGFGFAAGAMVYLVLHDLFPDALAGGREAGLDHGGRPELLVGILAGIVVMLPIMLVTG